MTQQKALECAERALGFISWPLLGLDRQIFSAKSPSQGNALIGALEEADMRTIENQEEETLKKRQIGDKIIEFLVTMH